MQTQAYLDEVTAHLSKMLTELPESDRHQEMSEIEATANGYLNLTPRRTSPATFSADLFSDPDMKHLVAKDEYRLAMSAETPSELVNNLMPNDGHLD